MPPSPPRPAGMGAARWAWLDAMLARVDAKWAPRRDHRETALTILRAMAWSADPETMLTKPTIARLIEVTGNCERSVQGWLRKIEHAGSEAGLVELTEPGTTPRLRPAILRRGGQGNLAREWRLIPPGQPNDTCVHRVHPYGDLFPGSNSRALDLDRNPPTRARERPPRYLRRRTQREGQGQNDRRSAPGSFPRPSVVPAVPPWPLERNPRRRPERLGAAEALRGAHPVLSRLSARELRSICRVYFRAQWTPQDVIWHAEHDLDGSPLRYGHAVILPARWLAWRLARWTAPDGTPLPPITAQREAERERDRERQAADLAALTPACAPADPAAYANEIRVRHGWRPGAVTRLRGA
jgi:hypothetical protein